MRTVALTGGIACGKTTVANMLRDLGASVVDADAISRALTAPGGTALPAICEAFGDTVFHADGTLHRAKLADIVFADEAQRERLNALMHPIIRQKMAQEAEECRKRGADIVVLDVPLLFESHMQDMADIVACVRVPQAVQVSRLKDRDGMTREQAIARIQSQMPLDQKAALSDVVIDTHRPLAAVQQTVSELYQGWLAAARKEHA